MNAKIKVAVAESSDIIREGLASLLKDQDSVKVLFSVTDGNTLFAKLKANKPEVLLLGHNITGSGDLLEKIKKQFPKIKIIIISTNFYEPAIIDLLKRGASSFLHINNKLDILISAIRSVHNQGVYFDSKVSAMIARELATPSESIEKIEFSERDLNILKLICEGYTSKQIGDQLFLNNRTVEWHRSQMMKKLHIRNVSALILYAVQNKLLST